MISLWIVDKIKILRCGFRNYQLREPFKCKLIICFVGFSVLIEHYYVSLLHTDWYRHIDATPKLNGVELECQNRNLNEYFKIIKIKSINRFSHFNHITINFNLNILFDQKCYQFFLKKVKYMSLLNIMYSSPYWCVE